MTPRRRGTAVSPSAKLVAAALAALAVGGGLVGCVQDPKPFDPRLAQEWERQGESHVRGAPLQVLPERHENPYDTAATTRPDHVAKVIATGPTGPRVRMGLREIVHRAVANNLDVRVASFDTAIDQTRVVEAEANFDPQFFSDISFERVDKEVGGGDAVKLAPGANVNSNNASSGLFQTFVSRTDEEALTAFDWGFRQNLAAGGKIQVSQSVNNSWFYPIRSLYNPYYENDLTISLQQPLLQNFGVEVNQARITIARNTQRISLLDFRKTTEQTVLQIEQTYWQLVQAQKDLVTAQDLVQLSEGTSQLLDQRRQKNVGVSNVEVTQALAQTEARQGDLARQVQQVRRLSVQLKLLMNDPSFPVSSATNIEAADEFTTEPLHFDVDDLVETALQNRYELGQQQVRIDSAEIAVTVARSGLLPSLTLNLAGTVDGLNRTLQSAFSEEGNFNHVGFQIGLQFVLPIGNRAARAVWSRSLLQRMQAIAGYGSEVEKVTADVQIAAIDIEGAWKQLYAAHKSVLAFRQELESLNAQVNSGNQALTFEFVFNLLQVQEQLAGQERAEHQAQNDYNYAIAQLEAAKGTILRYDNVMMEQEQLPFDLELPGDPDPRATPPGYPYPDRVRGPLAP